MRLCKLAFFFCIFIFSSLAQAKAQSEDEFYLTIINKTASTFYFSGVSGENPQNYFYPSRRILYPSQRMLMLCIALRHYDLAGNLHFLDENERDNVLTLIDYRKFHVGQLLLNMNNIFFKSALNTKHLSQSPHPFALTFDAANVSIQAS